MKNKPAQQYALLVGVRCMSPEGEPIILEVLAENGSTETIEAVQRGLIALLVEEGFTHISEPYTRTATFEELAEAQETSGSVTELFTYH